MSELSLKDFKEKLDDLKVSCEICGYSDFGLVNHLKVRHSMSVGVYRQNYPDKRVISKLAEELFKKVSRKPFTDDKSLDGLLFGTLSNDEIFKQVGLKRSVPKEQELLIPQKDIHYAFPKDLHVALYAVEAGLNVYIEGPTGCGKSEFVIQMFANLGRPVRRVNMHGETTASNFIGETGANQSGTFFKEGVLLEAMRGGYAIIVDEVDFTPPNIAAVLFPALEKGKAVFVPDLNETVIAAPGFQIFATANTGGKGDNRGAYTGTEIMNTAFLDRFPVKLKFDYLEQTEEITMLEARFPEAEQETIKQLASAAHEIRLAFGTGKLTHTLSTRKLIDLLAMKKALGLARAIEVSILNWMDEEDEALVREIMKRCAALS